MSISTTPKNPFVEICLYLTPGNLCRFSQTCKMFHSIIFSDFSGEKKEGYEKEIWKHHAIKLLEEIDGDIPFLKILGAKVPFSEEIFSSSKKTQDFVKFATLWKTYSGSAFLFAERNEILKTKKKQLAMIHCWIHPQNLLRMEALEKGYKPLKYLEKYRWKKFVDLYRGSIIPHLWFKTSQNFYLAPLIHVSGIYGDNAKFIKYLIYKEKVNINACSIQTNSLMRASRVNNIKIIKFLLTQPKIDVNAKAKNNWNALSTSINIRHKEIFEMLLQHEKINLNVSLGPQNLNSPLTLCMSEKNEDFFKQLIAHPKINIHFKPGGIMTCLEYAQASNQTYYISLLTETNN